MAIPIKGGPATTLVSGAEPLALAIDETSMYWVEKWALMRVSLMGGPTTQLAAVSFPAATIALDETSVYYAEDGKILRVPKNGDASSTIVATAVATEEDHQFPNAVAVSRTVSQAKAMVLAMAVYSPIMNGGPPPLHRPGPSSWRWMSLIYWTDSRMDRIHGHPPMVVPRTR
jgi:hypothetical protein